MICSCSGPFGPNTVPVEQVYRSWINTVNASGGINGHPIQLIFEDDASTPGTSVTRIQTLISDHVVAIADMSIVDEPWATTIQKAGIPIVGMDSTEVPFYNNPDFYAMGQTNDAVSYSVAATAKQAGAASFADFYCAESPGCSEQVPQIKADAKKLGVNDVYNAEITFTQPNYTAQCLAAKQAHADAVFIADGPQILARVANDCAQQGYNPAYIEEGEGFANILLKGAISKNLWDEFNNLPFFASTPAVQQLNAAVDKYYPTLRKNPETYSALAAWAWVAGLLLQDAIKAGGLTATDTPSAAEVVKGLTSLKGDTLDGWAPPLTFASGKTHSINCWFTGRVVNGVPSVTNNGQPTCIPGTTT
jgi:branched-chain amino acid transport system substrate-binding protein